MCGVNRTGGRLERARAQGVIPGWAHTVTIRGVRAT